MWVDADRRRLTQVLTNLLQNAAKFTNAGGRVTVELAPVPDDGAAVIRVRDTGIGMEPGMLARIFEAFSQAENSLDRTVVVAVYGRPQ